MASDLSSVDQGARLFGNAVVCGQAYVSQGAALSAEARAEDSAYIRGADLCGKARASGRSVIMVSPDTGKAPFLSGACVVYGDVMGDVHIMGQAVILNVERIYNETPGTLIINGQERSMVRDPSRDELKPRQPQEKQKKPRNRGRDR